MVLALLDLAVEILSPTDRPGPTDEKVRMWLDGGGRSVWVADPAPNRSVSIIPTAQVVP